MNFGKKIKAINSKTKQNKAQFNLDRQTAKISILSSGNVCKCEFLTGKAFQFDKIIKKEKLKYLVLVDFFNVLNKFNELKRQKRKDQMHMIKPQNYIMICYNLF